MSTFRIHTKKHTKNTRIQLFWNTLYESNYYELPCMNPTIMEHPRWIHNRCIHTGCTRIVGTSSINPTYLKHSVKSNYYVTPCMNPTIMEHPYYSNYYETPCINTTIMLHPFYSNYYGTPCMNPTIMKYPV